MPGVAIEGAAGQWLDVYSLTGFTVGSDLLIQNQTDSTFDYVESAQLPEVNRRGRRIYAGQEAQVDSVQAGDRVYLCCPQRLVAYVQRTG